MDQGQIFREAQLKCCLYIKKKAWIIVNNLWFSYGVSLKKSMVSDEVGTEITSAFVIILLFPKKVYAPYY